MTIRDTFINNLQKQKSLNSDNLKQFLNIDGKLYQSNLLYKCAKMSECEDLFTYRESSSEFLQYSKTYNGGSLNTINIATIFHIGDALVLNNLDILGVVTSIADNYISLIYLDLSENQCKVIMQQFNRSQLYGLQFIPNWILVAPELSHLNEFNKYTEAEFTDGKGND